MGVGGRTRTAFGTEEKEGMDADGGGRRGLMALSASFCRGGSVFVLFSDGRTASESRAMSSLN